MIPSPLHRQARGWEPVWTRRGPLWVPGEQARALTTRTRNVPLSSSVRAALDARAWLWIPQKGRLLVHHNMGSVGSATPGTSVTTGASASTKGTPAEIFTAASRTFDAFWVEVIALGYAAAATGSSGATDLLLGASTEEIIVADMLHGQASGFGGAASGPKRWHFPLYVPGGNRLAVQGAGDRTSTAYFVILVLYGGNGSPPFRCGGKIVTYGMGTVPDGTVITPGASGAEGTWTEIVASTNFDHFAFTPSFQVGTDTNTNARVVAVDLGIGAATEKMIAEGYQFTQDTGEGGGGPFPDLPTFQDVPSGTRLVMRASNSGTNDTGYSGVIHAAA